MSLPTFPPVDPSMTTCDSLNMILASIAMEELSLSHIINAEGEKLQYILGTLEGSPCRKTSVEEILAVNKSIKSLMDSVMQNQVILKGKMDCAVDALQEMCPQPTTPIEPPSCGSSDCCCAVSFPGRPKQCWSAETPLIWLPSECSRCCPQYLSSDGRKIILRKYGCYAVSFSIDLCILRCDDDCVSIRVQTQECDKQFSAFNLHVPISNHRIPITASAGGILVSTHNCSCASELMLILQSPSSVKVNEASICVMEI